MATIATRYTNPMNDAQIMRVAPSVFAQGAHESRSDRYSFVPTIEVLNALRREGFEVFEAKQSKTRLVDRREHTTHLLRMRHRSDFDTPMSTRAEHVELVLKNSSDGGSAYELMQGVYRLVCSNGMIAGNTMASIKVPHRGDIAGQVIEGSFKIVENTKELQGVIADWKSIQLTGDEQVALAHGAAALRFGEGYAEKFADPTRLLNPRRWEDKGNDLWNTFNRVQESVIKGGSHMGYKNGRRVTARGVTGVDQDLKLNKGLWAMADYLAKAKTGRVQDELFELAA